MKTAYYFHRLKNYELVETQKKTFKRDKEFLEEFSDNKAIKTIGWDYSKEMDTSKLEETKIAFVQVDGVLVPHCLDLWGRLIQED